MRRWIKSILIRWAIGDGLKPVIDVPRDMRPFRMSKSTIDRIHLIMESEANVEAIREFCEYHSAQMIHGVRVYTRQGKLQDASLQEGGAMVLEDLVGILKDAAEQHNR